MGDMVPPACTMAVQYLIRDGRPLQDILSTLSNVTSLATPYEEFLASNCIICTATCSGVVPPVCVISNSSTVQ